MTLDLHSDTDTIISACLFALNPPSDSIRYVAEALRAQTLDDSRWELVMIDNGSQPPLERTYRQDFAWHPNLRFVVEPQRGYAFCHRRAILEARSGLILFLGDDCILNPDYLESALQILEEHRDIGVLTGNIVLRNDRIGNDSITKQIIETVYPQANIKGLLKTETRTGYTAAMRGSAGMIVRKTVANLWLDKFWVYLSIMDKLKKGRHQFTTLRYTDLDFSMHALHNGFTIARSDQLEFVHFTSKEEVNFLHLIRLADTVGFNEQLFFARWGWDLNNQKLWGEIYAFLARLIRPTKRIGVWIIKTMTAFGRLRARVFLKSNSELIRQMIAQ